MGDEIANWYSGIDIKIEPLRDEMGVINIQAKTAQGKFWLDEPKCKFNDKDVKCLTFESESGGITSKILVSTLHKFDEIDLFPLIPVGSIPMLIVYDHHSQLRSIFLDYINNEDHN